MNIHKEREPFERHIFKDKYDELKYYHDNYELEYGYRYPPYTYDSEWETWLEAKSQAIPEGFVLVPFDVVDRCISHICLAMCHQNNSNSENDVMQMDLEALESALEAQEAVND